tara:strand:+ start:63050 stop:63463 length:414 start_codon:yes stop_codon:yes gene_type:complete
MKNIIILVISCFCGLIISAQDKPVKIVFDITSSDVSVHETAVKHVKLMATSYPNSKFELVVYSAAYTMVVKNDSNVLKQMEELGSIKNVDLVVCQASLNKHKIAANELISGVRAVPDGILEIVEKQGLGWGYIKEAK